MVFNVGPLPDRLSLEAALVAADTTVFQRSRGRTTLQTETHIIAKLLSALAQAERLTYPVKVEHGDRPDIRLSTPTETVGIEITEAVTQPWAEFQALAEREQPSTLMEMSHFSSDTPPKTTKKQRALLNQDRLTGSGWLGDEVEQLWASFIGDAVAKKLHGLAKPGFSLFSQNALAIYDNLPLMMVDIDSALKLVSATLALSSHTGPLFDVIYVISDPEVWEFSEHHHIQLI